MGENSRPDRECVNRRHAKSTQNFFRNLKIFEHFLRKKTHPLRILSSRLFHIILCVYLFVYFRRQKMSSRPFCIYVKNFHCITSHGPKTRILTHFQFFTAIFNSTRKMSITFRSFLVLTTRLARYLSRFRLNSTIRDYYSQYTSL